MTFRNTLRKESPLQDCIDNYGPDVLPATGELHCPTDAHFIEVAKKICISRYSHVGMLSQCVLTFVGRAV